MRLINRKIRMLTKLCSVTLLLATQLQAASLTVEVSGINDSDGIVHVGLYDKTAGFPDEHQYTQGRTVSAADCIDGKATVSFESLLPGEYAVAGYHDINNNDELDTNLVGIPQEPYGASLGARNMLSPPDYEDAKFKFDTQDMKISVEFQ
ncbi:MAG: DUF2141 domain-containing protein [Methylococcales bacterium]